MSLRKELGKFIRNDRGNTAIIVSVASFVIFAMGAFGVDVGSFYYQKRRLQTANDLAAISAASDLTRANAAAVATLGANSYGAPTLQKLELGTYVANPAIAASQRFTPNAGPTANAVRVSLQTTTPMIFGRMFPSSAQASNSGVSGNVTLSSQAIAASSAYASFAIGSRLLQVNGGLLNSLLGGLLGSNLSLSAMDFQSLISTQIDLLSFSNALATRINLTGVTYNSLIATNVKATDVIGAMIDASRAAPGGNATTVSALTSIAGSMSSSSATMQLNQLISFGPLGNKPVGTPALVAQSVSALDLLSAVAQISNGTHQVALNLGAAVPGILSATLKVTIGEMPVGTSWATVGFQGASVHTAQTRLLLQVQLAGSGSIAVVNVPIYIEIASGTATLNNITCGRPNIATSTVTLGVTPGIVTAWIGAVSDADMANFTTSPHPGPATLVNLPPLATISGLANASISNLSPTPVTFTYSQIQSATKQTTSTTDFLSSLLSSLIGNLQLNVNVIGLGIGLPGGLTGAVSGILAGAVSPVDQLLAGLLGTLGVGLGQADTWVSGVRCDGAVLVN
ncbi:Uncharacterized membrane protein [Rhizobiales bacterium GAS188]|nr:Uncharacterized membrane protein [Rhizobiales bacterium GAS188]